MYLLTAQHEATWENVTSKVRVFRSSFTLWKSLTGLVLLNSSLVVYPKGQILLISAKWQKRAPSPYGSYHNPECHQKNHFWPLRGNASIKRFKSRRSEISAEKNVTIYSRQQNDTPEKSCIHFSSQHSDEWIIHLTTCFACAHHSTNSSFRSHSHSHRHTHTHRRTSRWNSEADTSFVSAWLHAPRTPLNVLVRHEATPLVSVAVPSDAERCWCDIEKWNRTLAKVSVSFNERLFFGFVAVSAMHIYPRRNNADHRRRCRRRWI